MTTRNAPATRAQSNLTATAPKPLAERLGYEPQTLEFIRSEIANGAPDLQLEYFLRFCAAKQLDPTAREVYFIPRMDSGSRKWTVQIGIDGYRSLAERSGEYDGCDDATFDYESDGTLRSATVRVYRKGLSRGVSGTARWKEYVQTKDGRPTSMWAKMGHNQLAKCAEALALRKAFPRRLGGIYANEEMAQADNVRNVTPRVEVSGDTPRAAMLRTQIEAARTSAPEPEPEHEISEYATALQGKSNDEILAYVRERARVASVSDDELRRIISEMPGGKLTRGTAPMVLEIVGDRTAEAIEMEFESTEGVDFSSMSSEQLTDLVDAAAHDAGIQPGMLTVVLRAHAPDGLTAQNVVVVLAEIDKRGPAQ